MNFLRSLLGIKETVKVAYKPMKTPSQIDGAFSEKYGNEWYDYEPETIRALLKLDFGLEDDEPLVNKILATQVMMTNADLETDWDMFENVVLSFNDIVPDFSIMEVPTISELNYGYHTIKTMRPSYDPKSDVIAYIKGVMKEGGLLWSPWIGVETGDAPELTDVVKELWKVNGKTEDEAVGVQMDKLDLTKQYIKSYGN